MVFQLCFIYSPVVAAGLPAALLVALDGLVNS